MQESWGAEILDNAKQFDTLFSLYSTPCKTQASSCQLLGVKPDATSLFHMETEISTSGGAVCSPRSQPSLTPGLLLAHSKGSLQQQKIKYFNGLIVIFYTQAGFWYHQTQRTSKKIRPKLPPHFLILKWRSKQRGVSKTTELDKFFKINLAEACWVSLVLEMMKFKRMELKSGHEVVIRKVSK